MVPVSTMKLFTGGLRPRPITPTHLSTRVSQPTPIWTGVFSNTSNTSRKVAVETLPDPQGHLLAKMPSSTIVESNDRQVLKAAT